MWEIVSQQATMNQAVAYLTLVRGLNFHARTSAWLVDAIERYTAIGCQRVREAVAGLKAAGLIVQTHSGTRPLYYLPIGPEFERVHAPRQNAV